MYSLRFYSSGVENPICTKNVWQPFIKQTCRPHIAASTCKQQKRKREAKNNARIHIIVCLLSLAARLMFTKPSRSYDNIVKDVLNVSPPPRVNVVSLWCIMRVCAVLAHRDVFPIFEFVGTKEKLLRVF